MIIRILIRKDFIIKIQMQHKHLYTQMQLVMGLMVILLNLMIDSESLDIFKILKTVK
jgi:hypothetical protein